VLRSRDMTLADGIRYYQSLMGVIDASQDVEEGTRAFSERRQPVFKGR
jgi:E-phenylitaconyl-CoA hydratase